MKTHISAIVVDGPKGVGKTVVLDRLELMLKSKGLNPRRFKAERGEDPTLDMAEFLMGTVFQAKSKEVWLIDRFAATELVMRTLDETVPPEQLSANFEYLNFLMLGMCVQTIYLVCQNDTRLERMGKRGRDDDDGAFGAWIEFYKSPAASESGAILDTTHTGPEMLAKGIWKLSQHTLDMWNTKMGYSK